MSNNSPTVVNRREARPWLTQFLWDSIQHLQSQRLSLDAELICKTTARRYPDINESMARSELACAVRDGLIRQIRSSGQKGGKTGIEKDTYRLPEPDKVEKDSHDWYCFMCHIAGEVILCESCQRVYHPECIPEDLKIKLEEINSVKTDNPKNTNNVIPETPKEPQENLENSTDDSVINVSSSSDTAEHLPKNQNAQKELEPEKNKELTTNENVINEENNKHSEEEEINSKDLTTLRTTSIFKCDLCLLRETGNTKYKKIRRSTLNQLLLHTCTRLKERMPVVVTERHFVQLVSPAAAAAAAASASGSMPQQPTLATPPNSNETPVPANVVVNDQGEPWRWTFIVHRSMDILKMEQKAKQNRYRFMEEFKADAQLIYHDLSVYHGPDSPVTRLAEQMLEDCTYDIQEIEACRYCYKMSNEKPDDTWFCRPCKPPHELVYAQQTRFPYWPAKVIKREPSGRYDVRFFGGKHERALIDAKNIKPITSSPTKLNVKRTVAWTKAMQELCKHQEMLNEAREQYEHPSDFEEEPEPDWDPKLDTFPETPPPPPASHQSQTQVTGSSVIVTVPPLSRRHSLQTELSRRRGRPNISMPEVKRNPPIRKSEPPPLVKPTSVPNGPSREISKPNQKSENNLGSQPPRKRGKLLTNTPFLNSPTSSSGVSSASSSPSASEQRLIREMEQERLARRAVEERLARVEDELARIHETYRIAISETKRKLWCSQCEAEAIYHCCWSTAYCSTDCQQLHWQRKHKGECCRKR